MSLKLKGSTRGKKNELLAFAFLESSLLAHTSMKESKEEERSKGRGSNYVYSEEDGEVKGEMMIEP